MKQSSTFAPPLVFVIASSFFLGGCFEDEEAKIKDLEGELKMLAFDENRAQEFLVKAKEELAGYEKARVDLEKSEEIGKKLEERRQELEKVTSQSDELEASLESALTLFGKHQADYRTMVRKSFIGKEVDLSETLGDGFERARILSVSPLGIRIYTTSGPRSVSFGELTTDLKKSLQMDEEEMNAFRAKQAANAELRAEKYKEWKKGLAGRKEEFAQDEIVKRLKGIQKEIEGLERTINMRNTVIKDQTSRASQWARNSSKETGVARQERALKYSQFYRDKAQAMTDENSNTWLVITRLRAEMEDLKAMKKPGR